jgi:formamidopyrimidine-DNA glycosylase
MLLDFDYPVVQITRRSQMLFNLTAHELSPAAPVLQLRTAFVITTFHSYWQHLMLHMNIRGSSLIMHNIITGESRRMRGTTTTKVQEEQRKSPRNHDQFTTSSRDHIITADSSANGAAAAALRILLQQEYSKKSSSLSRPRAAAADDTHLDYSQPQTHPPKGN